MKYYFYIGWNNEGDLLKARGIHKTSLENLKKELKELEDNNLIYEIYGGFDTVEEANKAYENITDLSFKKAWVGSI